MSTSTTQFTRAPCAEAHPQQSGRLWAPPCWKWVPARGVCASCLLLSALPLPCSSPLASCLAHHGHIVFQGSAQLDDDDEEGEGDDDEW